MPEKRLARDETHALRTRRGQIEAREVFDVGGAELVGLVWQKHEFGRARYKLFFGDARIARVAALGALRDGLASTEIGGERIFAYAIGEHVRSAGEAQ